MQPVCTRCAVAADAKPVTPRRSPRQSPLFVSVLFWALAVLMGCHPTGTSVPMFEDVSESSGLADYRGMTYGAAWGDFDADGLPDLYVTNHLNEAKLFRNDGKGRFVDVTRQWFAQADLGGDKHGAAWADVDGDGRSDLVQLTGAERGVGAERKRLFMNRGARFQEIGEAAGMANPLSRTRMPLWVDLDRDGRLDLFQGAEERSGSPALPFVFMQRGGRFEATGRPLPFGSGSAPFCILTSLADQGATDIVCRAPQKNRTAQVFSGAGLPMEERYAFPVTAFEDIAAGDFDNDGFIDLFLARKNPAPPLSYARPVDNELIVDALLGASATEPRSLTFRSTGEVTFQFAGSLAGQSLAPKDISIGAGGAKPEGLLFRLSPKTPGVEGATRHDGHDPAINVRFTQPDKWEINAASPRPATPGAKTADGQIGVKVTSSRAITDAAVVRGAGNPEQAPARLLMNRAGKLVDESDKWGVNRRIVSAVNVVAADFNNDQRLDIFVLASGDIAKQENLLLLNRGDGRFETAAAAGGAGGGTRGVGDSVTVADFDGDGFLDLLVATGGSMGRSLGFASEHGGYRLYRNRGNANHWLAIDLEGTVSNRDGIGARVDLVAGGVRQVRVQDGGIHHRGQNHARLHFGLGRNSVAASVTVRWPSGAVQHLRDVAGDRIIRIKEQKP